MSRPTVKTLDLVWRREVHCCFLCRRVLVRGRGDYSVHHRRPRGMGGTKDKAANLPANLLLLCGSGTSGCHGWIERNRAIAIEHGIILRQRQDPEQVPVSWPSWAGPVLLDNEGGRKLVTSNGSQADQAGA